MRKPLHSIASLAAAGLLSLAVVPSHAAPRAERELLGIRIWNKYSDVLARYGQPTRIENGLVTSSGDTGQTVAGGAPGMGGAAGMGMPGMMGRMGSGGPMGMPGAPGRMGSGGPMGMGMPGMPGGMMGSGGKMGGMMGGMPGMPGMPGMMGGGKMGGEDLGGGMGMPGGPGMPGMPGVGGSAGAQGEQSDEARQTWIYQRGPITNFFVFNKDGRVVQIESSGLSGSGGVTAQGVRLGDPVAKVYRAYGWTGKVAKNGPAALLDYTRESHAAFVVQDRGGRGPVVVDIMVTLLDVGPPNPLGTGAAVAGGPGMGMPGAPMGMGMPGRPGSGGPMGMGMPGRPGMGMPMGAMGGMGGKRGMGGMGADK